MTTKTKTPAKADVDAPALYIIVTDKRPDPAVSKAANVLAVLTAPFIQFSENGAFGYQLPKLTDDDGRSHDPRVPVPFGKGHADAYIGFRAAIVGSRALVKDATAEQLAALRSRTVNRREEPKTRKASDLLSFL